MGTTTMGVKLDDATSERIKSAASRIARTPLGRLGMVDDIARVVCCLASDESCFVTGQTLTADGGFTTANL